jgi:hypothetical protein
MKSNTITRRRWRRRWRACRCQAALDRIGTRRSKSATDGAERRAKRLSAYYEAREQEAEKRREAELREAREAHRRQHGW